MCFQSPSSLGIGLMKEMHQRGQSARLALAHQLRQLLLLCQKCQLLLQLQAWVVAQLLEIHYQLWLEFLILKILKCLFPQPLLILMSRLQSNCQLVISAHLVATEKLN